MATAASGCVASISFAADTAAAEPPPRRRSAKRSRSARRSVPQPSIGIGASVMVLASLVRSNADFPVAGAFDRLSPSARSAAFGAATSRSHAAIATSMSVVSSASARCARRATASSTRPSATSPQAMRGSRIATSSGSGSCVPDLHVATAAAMSPRRAYASPSARIASASARPVLPAAGARRVVRSSTSIVAASALRRRSERASASSASPSAPGRIDPNARTRSASGMRKIRPKWRTTAMSSPDSIERQPIATSASAFSGSRRSTRSRNSVAFAGLPARWYERDSAMRMSIEPGSFSSARSSARTAIRVRFSASAVRPST